VEWVGVTRWEMKGRDETNKLQTNNITNRISDCGHKRCENNESIYYFKENYEFCFTQENDVRGRILEDGWTKEVFNKDRIGDVA
jgi:hypothetical protein